MQIGKKIFGVRNFNVLKITVGKPYLAVYLMTSADSLAWKYGYDGSEIILITPNIKHDIQRSWLLIAKHILIVNMRQTLNHPIKTVLHLVHVAVALNFY